MKTISHFNLEQAPVSRIVIVVTTNPDYEMNRIIVYEGWPDYGNVTIGEGFHCSCYGFDETQWEAIEYETEAEMLKVVSNWAETGYGVERQAVAPILRYFTPR